MVFILLLSKALKVDCLWSDGDDVLSADFVKSLPGEVKFVEITRSSVKGSEAWITLRCPVHQHSIATFTVSFIARSSPCGREYLETLRDVRNRKDTLSRYYCYPQFTQSVFDYTHIWALTPKISYTVNCADHGTRVFKQFLPSDWLKMEVDKNLTGDADCVDSMEKQSKRKIAFVTPIDAIYLLVFRVENINVPEDNANHCLFSYLFFSCSRVRPARSKWILSGVTLILGSMDLLMPSNGRFCRSLVV